MVHKDVERENLREGFYFDIGKLRVYYFTGNYSEDGKVVAEGIEKDPHKIQYHTHSVTDFWKRIENPQIAIASLRNHSIWMQEKISHLEQAAHPSSTDPGTKEHIDNIKSQIDQGQASPL